ncbi:MAG TPA: four helix bundle protein [Patescibacteria group bacterium]|nr:four helix bundle protein [Patescibacteria group bacterium]
MRPSNNPSGFKFLRTWSQANEILELLEKFVPTLPARNPVTSHPLTDLKDHMQRSMRSVIRNIEEGYARTSTHEYISFLGFSLGSLEELIGDLEFCREKRIGDQEILAKLIRLCHGEAMMLNNQIKALEKKRLESGNISEREHAKLIVDRQKKDEFDQEKFLAEIREKYLKGKHGF